MSVTDQIKPVVDEGAPQRRRRAFAGALAGTVLEWYDFFIYGTASALVFPAVFFSNLEGGVALFVSLATFAAGFVLRPLGGLLFGHMGDRHGRKVVLFWTLLLMGAGTLLIGFLPTYAQIGALAPILLITLRAIQGLGLGGEWGGASLLSIEHAPRDKRGVYGSVIQIGISAGNLLAAGIFALVALFPDSDFSAWAWRIPFILSGLILAVAIFIRLRIDETPAFLDTTENGTKIARVPFFEMLRHSWRPAVLLFFAVSGTGIAFSVLNVFSLTYIADTLGLPRGWGLTGVMLGAGLTALLAPFYSSLSDKYGRKRVAIIGNGLLILFVFPMFLLFATENPILIALAILLPGAFGHAIAASLNPVLAAEQFPVRYRTTGMSFSFQLSGAIAVGTAPAISVLLYQSTASYVSVAIYMIVACLVAIGAIALLRETYKVDVQEAQDAERTGKPASK